MVELGEDKIVVNTYCINDGIHQERMDTLNICSTGDRVRAYVLTHTHASFSASFIYLFIYFGLANILIENVLVH